LGKKEAPFFARRHAGRYECESQNQLAMRNEKSESESPCPRCKTEEKRIITEVEVLILVPRCALRNAVPRRLDAVAGPRGMAVGAESRGSRVGSRSPVVDFVACTAAADVVDGCGVLHEALLLGELLVEAEDGALLLVVHVASTATAGSEVGIGWGSAKLGGGSGTLSVGAGGDVHRVDSGDVAGSAAAVACIVGRWDGWVWLGDAVVARHF